MALVLLGMLLELAGLGLIVPALSAMVDPLFLEKYPRIQAVFPAVVHYDPMRLVVFATAALCTVFVVKTAYMIWLARYQGRLIFSIKLGVADQLFEGYLRRGYSLLLGRNSSELIRNTTTEVNLFVDVLQASVLVMTEITVFSGIVAFLIYYEPYGALIVLAVLSSVTWGFQNYTKKRVLEWGRRRQQHDGEALRFAKEGFLGLRDICVLTRTSWFIRRFNTAVRNSANSDRGLYVTQQLPRHCLELASVVALGLLVLAMYRQGKGVQDLVPVLGLFTVSAFRVLPSLNRLISGLQTIRYGAPVIDLLDVEFRETEPVPGATAISHRRNGSTVTTFCSEITLKGASYRYPGNDEHTLDDVNMVLPRGKSVGLIGTSGSGKSTLADLIMGLLEPTAGAVLVDRVVVSGSSGKRLGFVGYVPQEIYLLDGSISSNVAFGVPANEIDESRLIDALRAARLSELVNALPAGINEMIGENGIKLSGGQRQRLGIARAFYGQPDLLVFDEATSALDVRTEKEIMDIAYAEKGERTYLIIAHRPTTIARCDFVYRIEDGRITESGTYGEVVRRA